MKLVLNISLINIILLITSCEETWYQKIDSPQYFVSDSSFQYRKSLPLLTEGVLVNLMYVYSDLASASDLISDQIEFSQKVNFATFSVYDQLDGRGRVDLADDGSRFHENFSCVNNYAAVGRLRKHADFLIETFHHSMIQTIQLLIHLLFIGYLAGGLSRSFMQHTLL